MFSSHHITKEFVIINAYGLHARPAGIFVKAALKFESKITVTNLDNGKTADGKSILDMLMLASPKGTRILVDANGKDAAEAMNVFQKMFDEGFGE